MIIDYSSRSNSLSLKIERQQDLPLTKIITKALNSNSVTAKSINAGLSSFQSIALLINLLNLSLVFGLPFPGFNNRNSPVNAEAYRSQYDK